MTGFWVGALLVGCLTTVATLTSWRHRVRMADLGSVSDGWLAEQRATSRHNSDR